MRKYTLPFKRELEQIGHMAMKHPVYLRVKNVNTFHIQNVNRTRLHHRNQRPKEYLCAHFGQFWSGSASRPLTFGDLWRSRL